ncbi:MAG: hypothetical protein A2044_01465 [Candidatus Firestonebacteria bacterium GWA2_43_8]|nr:MAG: hypothetical protein A2044_01465 [Candidatus Firestonebacteria bacterium GWA2_43_8]
MGEKEEIYKRVVKKVYIIREQEVMLDVDLAGFFGVEIGEFRRTVTRNKRCFDGEDILFRLTESEYQSIYRKKTKYLPFAFTELGMTLLTSVLKSPLAIKLNKMIIREVVSKIGIF